MFGMGMPEILLILAIALVVIGPKKLPDLAKSLGRALGEFRRATDDIKSSLDADGDLKEVKDTFDDMQNDIRNAMAVDPTEIYRSGEPDGDAGRGDDSPPADDPAAKPSDPLRPSPADSEVSGEDRSQPNTESDEKGSDGRSG
jgi:sec-independent protein translocase protein TatB